MAFRFEFEIGQSEQIRASRVMSHRRWDTRIAYLVVLLSILAVLGYWAYFTSHSYRVWGEGMTMILGAAVVVSAGVYMTPYWIVRSIRKNNRAAAGPHVYTLNDSGIEAESPGTRTVLEWANVAEAYETKEFLFLYVSKGYAALLPKRIVTSETLPNLRLCLRRWLGDRARLLGIPVELRIGEKLGH